jgi:O-antigen/teichoic acid export membrane protein
MDKGKIGLLKNVSSLGFVQIANYVFPILTLPIISRIIGPDKFGIINFSASFIAYFTLLIGFGFDLTATRRVAGDPLNAENRNKVFSEVFMTQCLLLLLSIIIFLFCLFLIPQLRQEKTVAIYTFITCFATVLTQNWLFQAMQDLSKVAILSLVSKILFTIMVLTLVRTRQDYIWQPLSLSLSQLLVAVLSFAWSINKYKIKLYKVKIINCVKLLWEEKIFFFSLCFISFYANTSIVILGIFQNSKQVGYYTSGQKLILIIQSVVTLPLSQAFFPYIGKAFAESRESGIKIAQKLFKVVFISMSFTAVSIIILSPLFVKIFYGREFIEAIVVCRILAFVPLCTTLGTVCGINVMMNLKMDNYFFKIIGTSACLSIILNILFVNRFGFISTACIWAVTELVNITLTLIVLNRHGIHFLNKNLFDLKSVLKVFKIFKL